jgi:hypothetical protein
MQIIKVNKMIEKKFLLCLFFLISCFSFSGFCSGSGGDGDVSQDQRNSHYITNQPPLAPQPYTMLPIGNIKPAGWLREQLVRMSKGMTGDLDKLYEKVLGARNGWLGGDGDGWERGPYWIDGLLPLAYILHDQKLIDRVKPWIEWTIGSRTEEGYFGPVPFAVPPGKEEGLQRGRRRDWWPKMVMLKVLQQYYLAAKDKRVIRLMTEYFRYQLNELPKTPLDHWSFWANRRGGDNMMVVYWLYNITNDKFLLELAEILNKQTYPYTDMFFKGDVLSSMRSFHCVNLAQGIKQPIIYFQQHPEQKYIDAVKKAFVDIRKYHGQPQGMYGADELLHGMNPTQGSEFCSTVEMMFSLENMLSITGDVQFADHLEKLAFNSLPTQANDDYTARQYYQQPNQVKITAGPKHFYTDHGYDIVYGITTGYPCCTANMHQGWPKLTQNLWYASADNGLAALIYAPSEVKARVADGEEVSVTEETAYPFDEIIRFKFESKKPVTFAFHLRIPGWCEKAGIKINGKLWGEPQGNQIVRIKRRWKSRDQVELILPMQLRTSRWYEDSAAVERGPLVYALRIEEDWKYVKSAVHPPGFYEVYAKSPWNFGLKEEAIKDPESHFTVVKKGNAAGWPWNLKDAPVMLKARGIRIPSWQLYDNMAGPLPPGPRKNYDGQPGEEIILIPYGCTTLRISEFPVIR